MNDTPKLTKADLAQFTGTETWYRHWFKRHVLYTEGVQFLAERAGAYWLIDEIALSQDIAAIARQPFQTWTLTVNADRTALLNWGDSSIGTETYAKADHAAARR